MEQENSNIKMKNCPLENSSRTFSATRLKCLFIQFPFEGAMGGGGGIKAEI